MRTYRVPIIGTAETFRWSVGFAQQGQFSKGVSHFDDPDRISLEPMFS